jgi:hypothetical protein
VWYLRSFVSSRTCERNASYSIMLKYSTPEPCDVADFGEVEERLSKAWRR